MEEKLQKVITVLLTIIVMLILFIISVVILKKQGYLSFNNKENIKENILSYEDVVGEYIAEFNNLKVEDSSTNKATFNLKLYKNGVFTYRYSGVYVPEGIIGNYIINDNKIILTPWFNTGSDVSLLVTKGTKELIFNDDKTITDNNIKIKLITDSGFDKAILVRSNNELKDFDISDSLSNACFYDKCGKVFDSKM